MVHHYGINSQRQLSDIWIDQNEVFQLKMKPQHHLTFLFTSCMAWYNEFHAVYSIREYQFNVAENY